MLAKINGERIECGGCGGLLAKLKGKVGTINILEGDNLESETIRSGISFEIKCKARKNGVSCNEINTIEL